MAKAKIKTSDGKVIDIDGTPDEIAAVLGHLGATVEPSRGARKAKAVPKAGKTGPSGHVQSLIDEEFFRPPKGLNAVREKLAAMGHHYPRTSLSPVLIRAVRNRFLRRMKEKGKWVYAQ